MPALWQEVGQEHTKRPKEKVTQFCSFKCLACGHESRHKNTQAGPPGCAGRQRHGLLWQELTEWSRRVWERQWPRSNYSLWREIPSLVWGPEGSPEKSFVNSHSPFISLYYISSCPLPSRSVYLSTITGTRWKSTNSNRLSTWGLCHRPQHYYWPYPQQGGHLSPPCLFLISQQCLTATPRPTLPQGNEGQC